MSFIMRSICSLALRFCNTATQQPIVATSTENATTTSFSRLCPVTEKMVIVKNSSQNIQSADCRLTLAASQPTVGQLSADCWPTVDRLLADCRPPVDRLLANCRPTVGQLSTDCWPTVYQQLANSLRYV